MTRHPLAAPLAVALAFALPAAPSAQALENRYDALARMIAPIAAVFEGSSGTQSVRANFTVLELTGAPKEFLGRAFAVAIQPPDRLAVTAEILGQRVTVCRNRQQVWAAPASQFEAILTQLEPLPVPDPKYTMGLFRLPFTPGQVALLPALFVATDAGAESIDGQACRVLDLKPAPELAKGLGTDAWSARLWIATGHKPARLLLRLRGWRILVGFHRIEYGGKLPDSHWMPGSDDHDAIGLGAARLSQIMKLLARELDGRP